MAHETDWQKKIEAYFNDKMSLEEEGAFMQQLDADEFLRSKFEEELKIRAIMDSLAPSTLQQEDAESEHLHALNVAHARGTRKIMKNWLLLAAAAAVLIFVVMIGLINHTNDKAPQYASHNLPADSDKNILRAGVDTNEVGKKLYTQFYAAYNGDSDPVEVSYYYNQYKNGNYKAVLSAQKNDLQQMGTNSNADKLDLFLQLYKGLSYLGESDIQNAARQFNIVLKRADRQSRPYYEAQWYEALTALRTGNIQKVDSTMLEIIQEHSPYSPLAKNLRDSITSSFK